MEEPKLLEEEDPYTRLGENIWSSILSRLPLREAIRTSIISRTWRNAFAKFPRVHFNSRRYMYNEEKLITILGNILTSHYGPIKICTIEINVSPTTHPCIDGWISNLIGKSINEFTLTLSYLDSYRVPHSLFNCKSICYLKLTGCSLRADRNLSFTCSNMRSVILHYGSIDEEFIQVLLSECRYLERLTLDGCYVDGCDEGSICVDASHLKSLKLANLRYQKGFSWELLHIKAPHLKRLKLGEMIVKEADIIAPVLEKFSCYLVGSYHRRTRHGCSTTLKSEVCKIEEVLSGIAYGKVLKLSLYASKCLLAGSLRIPAFMKFMKVETELDLTEQGGVMFFVSIFRCFPCLEELIFQGKKAPLYQGHWKKNKSLDHDYWEKQDQLSCFNYTLKRVTIKCCSEYDMDFSKYVLARAKVLEHLKITIHRFKPSEDYLRSLTLVEKASKEATLTVTYDEGTSQR